MRFRFPASPAWRRLYAAFSISACGDELTKIALLAKAYELGGQVSGVAAVGIAQALPPLVIGPLAGALADRGRKRSLLLLADFARCALLLAVALADSLPLVLVLAALIASCSALFLPVEAALEPDLLPREEIPRANSIRVATRNLLMIAGPALAGILLVASPLATAFVVDGATYAASGLLLLGLPRRLGPTVGVGAGQGGEGLIVALRQGLRFVGGQQDLRWLFLAQVTLILLMGMQGPVLYGFVAQHLEGGAEDFAVLMTALGVGSLIGSWLLHRLLWLQRSALRLLMGTLAIDALALCGFTFGRTVWICALFMVFLGLISAVFLIVLRTYLQTVPPAAYRGRTLGLFTAVQGPLSILSLALVLPLVEVWSPALILRGAALAEMAVAVTALLALRFARVPGRGPRGTDQAE